MKSVAVTYLLWFFLGALGLHQFYTRNNAAGFVYLGIWLGMVAFALIPGGQIVIFPLWILFMIMWIADLFLIPGRVARFNERERQYQDERLLAIIRESKV